jgi:hypothetical protein
MACGARLVTESKQRLVLPKSRWLLSLLGTAAAAALAGGVALALPQGGEEAEQKAAPAAQSARSESTANQATVTIGSMAVEVDPKTGEIQPLTSP